MMKHGAEVEKELKENEAENNLDKKKTKQEIVEEHFGQKGKPLLFNAHKGNLCMLHNHPLTYNSQKVNYVGYTMTTMELGRCWIKFFSLSTVWERRNESKGLMTCVQHWIRLAYVRSQKGLKKCGKVRTTLTLTCPNQLPEPDQNPSSPWPKPTPTCQTKITHPNSPYPVLTSLFPSNQGRTLIIDWLEIKL